ncbi:MAG: hypothetical protein ACKVP3_06750 [Hyphomicrobiaceae bacterium]
MIVQHALDFLTRLRQTWRRILSRRRALNELAACPPGELRRIASDVGLSGDDLRRLYCGHNGPSELLPQRLQLLGIDPEFVRHAAPTTFRDLARVCASCKASRRCARDLARGDVQAGMDSYCLNGPIIDALTVRDGRRFISAETGRWTWTGR